MPITPGTPFPTEGAAIPTAPAASNASPIRTALGLPYFGEGVPDNGTGTEGEYYIDGLTGVIYKKGAAVWTATQIGGVPNTLFVLPDAPIDEDDGVNGDVALTYPDGASGQLSPVVYSKSAGVWTKLVDFAREELFSMHRVRSFMPYLAQVIAGTTAATYYTSLEGFRCDTGVGTEDDTGWQMTFPRSHATSYVGGGNMRCNTPCLWSVIMACNLESNNENKACVRMIMGVTGTTALAKGTNPVSFSDGAGVGALENIGYGVEFYWATVDENKKLMARLFHWKTGTGETVGTPVQCPLNTIAGVTPSNGLWHVILENTGAGTIKLYAGTGAIGVPPSRPVELTDAELAGFYADGTVLGGNSAVIQGVNKADTTITSFSTYLLDSKLLIN